MELYHVLNRGVEKRNIFLDNKDRERFVRGLELFNDTKRVDNFCRTINGTSVRPTRSNREPLVKIHGWCLMRNHYHLLISEIVEGGVTKFLMKLNVGYAKYFNERYKRSGTLFQSRTKKVLVSNDAHFLHILNYIHLNPLDYKADTRNWREGKVNNTRSAVTQLSSYRWSSYWDYCNQPNFPDLLTTTLFKEVFTNYQKSLSDYLNNFQTNDIGPFTLE